MVRNSLQSQKQTVCWFTSTGYRCNAGLRGTSITHGVVFYAKWSKEDVP